MNPYRDIGVTITKRIISEPDDHTRYDYIVIELGDDYVFAPFGSTFAFPQRLNWFEVKDIVEWKGAAKYIDDNDLDRKIHLHTFVECVNCIKELRNEKDTRSTT